MVKRRTAAELTRSVEPPALPAPVGEKVVRAGARYMATAFGAKLTETDERRAAPPKTRKPAAPSRPMTPGERRARDFARLQLQPEAANLPSNGDVDAQPAQRANAVAGERGNVERARRMDAFEALKASMQKLPGAYDAARRLERDVLTRRGLCDKGRPMERLDGQDPEGCLTDRMIAAGRRVDMVMRHIGERDGWLLLELISPCSTATLSATTWRGIVQYVTGETHMHGQASSVRAACANLAAAYRRCDNPAARAA